MKEVNMKKNKVNWMSFVLIVLVIICQACGEITLDEALASAKKTTQRNKELLLSIPPSTGTVGTILLAEKQGKLYMLLARENINALPGQESDPKWLSKRGTFSDLGGSTGGDTTQTFLHHIQRELREESMGMVDLGVQPIIQNGQLIYKVSPKGRKIMYLVYLLSPQEFVPQDVLNNKRIQEADSLPEASLEKDLFLWCEITPFLQESLPEEVKINDWNGQEHAIKLRKFFIQDALTDDFRKIVSFFQKSIAIQN
jgi:hypothetical protein